MSLPDGIEFNKAQLLPRWAPLIVTLAAVCLDVFVFYRSTLHLPFVADDLGFIVGINSKAGGNPGNAFTNFPSAYFRPAVSCLAWVISFFSGDNPYGYRLANAILDGINAGLIFAIFLPLNRLLSGFLNRPVGERVLSPGKAWVGGLASALYFLMFHPHGEPVIWVVGMCDTLSTTFSLLALWLYLAFRLGRKYPSFEELRERPSWWKRELTMPWHLLFFSLLFFSLAIVSKESALALLPLIAFLEILREPVLTIPALLAAYVSGNDLVWDLTVLAVLLLALGLLMRPKHLPLVSKEFMIAMRPFLFALSSITVAFYVFLRFLHSLGERLLSREKSEHSYLRELGNRLAGDEHLTNDWKWYRPRVGYHIGVFAWVAAAIVFPLAMKVIWHFRDGRLHPPGTFPSELELEAYRINLSHAQYSWGILFNNATLGLPDSWPLEKIFAWLMVGLLAATIIYWRASKKAPPSLLLFGPLFVLFLLIPAVTSGPTHFGQDERYSYMASSIGALIFGVTIVSFFPAWLSIFVAVPLLLYEHGFLQRKVDHFVKAGEVVASIRDQFETKGLLNARRIYVLCVPDTYIGKTNFDGSPRLYPIGLPTAISLRFHKPVTVAVGSTTSLHFAGDRVAVTCGPGADQFTLTSISANPATPFFHQVGKGLVPERQGFTVAAPEESQGLFSVIIQGDTSEIVQLQDYNPTKDRIVVVDDDTVRIIH